MRLEQPHLALVIHYHHAGLDLMRGDDVDETDVDAVVELTPETFSEWISGASIERLMFDGKLAVRGRIHLLEATRDLLFDLDIDWESELARWLVLEEARLLPGRQQRSLLREHLTELEVATDRLEARLNRLQRRLEQLQLAPQESRP